MICSYIDDIYLLADALTRQDDIKLIRRKDYISNPKPNGYRSLHLIFSVPIFFAESVKEVKAEVRSGPLLWISGKSGASDQVQAE